MGKESRGSRLILLLPFYLASVLGPFTGNAVLALVPTFQADFGVDVTAAAAAITSFMVPYALIQFVSGAISDIYDRRVMAIIGVLLFGLGSAVCAAASVYELFLVARAIQGVGGAFILPVAMAAIGDSVPTRHIGKAMGFFGAITTAGVALGPLAGGAAAMWDWRLLFIALVVFSVIIAAMIAVMRTTGASTGARRDTRGEGVVAMVGTKSITLVALISFLPFFAMLGMLTFTSDYLSDGWGLEAGVIGLIITGAGVASMLMSPIAGWAVDRLGRYSVLVLGLVIVFACMSLLVAFNTPGYVTAGFIVLGIGMALVFSALGTIAIDMSPQHRGALSSVYNGSRFAGGALAPMAFSPVYAVGIGAVFAFAATCVIACTGLALVLRSVTGARTR